MRDYVNTNNWVHEKKKNVAVLGDGIITHNNGWDIEIFLGRRSNEQKDHVKTPVRQNLDHFILHIGATNLNSDKIWKNELSDVSISSIILRNDNFNEKAAEINDHLARLCKERNIYI